MARLRARESEAFTKFEVEHMLKLLKEAGEETLSQNFCEKLARKFSRDPLHAGKPVLQWMQVQSWFKRNYRACQDKVTLSSIAPKVEVVPHDVIDVSVPNSEPENSFAIPTVQNIKEIAVMDLEFEAKSSKDGAWFDVALFISHRVLSSGESEVRVRFVGFGSEEDEWVNVKNAVRERSIPIESSECKNVKVGDLVLCFQEKEDESIYYDAHVLEIKRRLHDIRGCRCLFLVRYDHDDTEEQVQLRRLCRRPSS